MLSLQMYQGNNPSYNSDIQLPCDSDAAWELFFIHIHSSEI